VAARGVDNMRQAIANRLKTRQGELAALGHPGYGSRHHELIGEPNVPRTRNLIKLYVLQALRDEPRIEKVLRVDVFAERSPPRDVVRIELDVRLIDVPTALNLVFPFSLEPRL
jgi:phage baseplate assembly protein W